MRKALLKGVCASVAAVLWAGASWSQTAATPAPAGGDQLEEVTVTAERFQEDLQKTPMNITVVSGQSIAENGMTSMEDALTGLPGVTVQGQVRGFVPSIRGLGTDLPPGSAQGQVATEVDGVYDIRAETGRVGYYDLQRIEVLAGPQGTLYGVNSDGGVVNVISNDPVIGSYQSSGSITVGNYDLLSGQGMVNLPVSASSSLRVAISAINRSGFLTNTGADDDVAQGGRAKYLFQPNDNFSLLLGYETAHLGGKGQGSVPGYINGNSSPVVVDGRTWSSPWTDQSYGTTSDDTLQWDDYHSDKYWGQMKWNVGIGTLSFTPSYKVDYDTQYSCGMGASCTYQGDPIKLDQNSEELRFASNPGTSVQWAVGYYHWGYLEAEAGMGPGAPPPVTYYATTDGAFAETTWSFTDTARLITGVRENRDWKKETDIGGVGGTTGGNWSHFDYRAGLEYDLTPQSMEYLTVATGYRPGGYNGDGSTYKTEQVRDIEVGTKNRFFSDRVQINADAYYYDISNFQLLDFYFSGACLNLAPPPPTYNLGAREIGVDLGLQGAISSDDTVKVQLAYMNNKFTSSQVIAYNPPTSCPPGFGGNAIVDAYTVDNSPLPRSPKLSGTASYEHRFTLASGAQLSATPDVHFSQATYINPVENPYGYQPGYALWDFTLLFRSADAKYTVSAWLRNAGDLAVKTQLNPAIIGEPRTYGLTVSANLN